MNTLLKTLANEAPTLQNLVGRRVSCPWTEGISTITSVEKFGYKSYNIKYGNGFMRFQSFAIITKKYIQFYKNRNEIFYRESSSYIGTHEDMEWGRVFFV